MQLMAAVSTERVQVENRNGFKRFGNVPGWQFWTGEGVCGMCGAVSGLGLGVREPPSLPGGRARAT